MMPTWMTILIGIAAGITALGVIWAKFIRPSAVAITTWQETVPVLASLVEAFKKDDETFAVLQDISRQFRTNSGTTLRDLVNRLETASIVSAEALVAASNTAAVIAANLEVQRQLGEQDRIELHQLIARVNDLTAFNRSLKTSTEGAALGVEASE